MEFATDGGGGDNLGDHTATQDLDLDGNDILNPGSIDGRDVSADGATLDGHSSDITGLQGDVTGLTADLAAHEADVANPHATTLALALRQAAGLHVIGGNVIDAQFDHTSGGGGAAFRQDPGSGSGEGAAGIATLRLTDGGASISE
jgi:hypothetical protein